jgi:starch synthase (maltosyl-transferring)
MGRFPAAPLQAPRIYCRTFADFGKKPALNKSLEQIAALGFTHVLVTEPYQSGMEKHPLLRVPAEFGAIKSALDSATTKQHLTDFCCAATRNGLIVLINVSLERSDRRGALVMSLLPWTPARGAPLDPRAQDFGQPGIPLPWDDTVAAAALVANFNALFARCVALGVGGFVIGGANQVGPAELGALCAGARRSNPQTAVILDATGMPAAHALALQGCPLSGVVGSFGWWNYHDTWFYLEHQRLAAIAPVIFATHGVPPPVERLSGEQLQGARDDALRRIAIAALLGDGLMTLSSVLRLDDGSQSLQHALVRASQWMDATGPASPVRRLRLVSAPGAPIVVVSRTGHDGTLLEVAINTAHVANETPVTGILSLIDRPSARLALLAAEGSDKVEATLALTQNLALKAFEVRPMRALDASAVVAPRQTKTEARERLRHAIATSRVVLEAVSPTCDEGRFAVAADVSTLLEVRVDAYCDGHDKIAVRLQWKPCDETQWREVTMLPEINDRYLGVMPLERLGTHEFRIIAWVDRFGSWRSDTDKKRAAGRDLKLETVEGLTLVSIWADDAQHQGLKDLVDELNAAPGTTEEARLLQLDILFRPETLQLMQSADRRPNAATTDVYPVNAERRTAHFASWYELFPRSMSPVPGRHGTLIDVIDHLPRIAAMGFDVLYFPPIHPIGSRHRKGKNNQLTASEGDPGSPYAIGGPAGGHDALHPELGTLDDFRELLRAAAKEGLEIALDFAIQCSPDHPWLKEHAAWFQFRADGTVRYAENPPKTYEDIVNVDFYTTRATKADPEPALGLWSALRDIVLFWASHGVRIFRVDNPHTKPLPFWHWMIGEVRARHPDVLFLAEAFTRPKMMARLAKVGFSQSYTYFTWRHSRYELTTYLTELNASPLREVYRPHFFVNTPDINPYFLQSSGRAGFLIRAALASLLSGLWGMYSGFEICEGEPVPGKEEYLDSEKYQLRERDFTQAGNIVAEITRLNQIRRTNPALSSHLGVKFYSTANEAVLFFAKSTPNRDNVILAAVSLDPHHAQEFDYELPLWEWQLPDDASLFVEDLVDDYRFTLHGKHQRMRLEPWHRPYAIWRVSRSSA